MSDDTPEVIASTWLSAFRKAVEDSDPLGVAATFLPHGWLRDVLTFTWNTRSIKGPADIASYLSASDTFVNAGFSQIKFSSDPYLRPSFSPGASGLQRGVEAGFDFEMPHALGRGYCRLGKDASGAWKALTVCTMLWDLKGYEELVGPRVDWEAEDHSWIEEERNRQQMVETNPYVLIIGGGHIGLTVAARFNQMDISALVIDQHPRIGDSWRRRYQSLRFHNPNHHHQMLYQPFPSNWPTYTPRDMMADWLESYAIHQCIVHWVSSGVEGKPVYDLDRKAWTVTVNRAGQEVQLRPAHIVVATGSLGAPYVPTLHNRGAFPGTAIHATEYVKPAPFQGQHVVVVGAANTAVDICEDLARGGAASVTMVQRGATCVVSRESIRRTVMQLWPLHVPIGTSDFKAASMPLGLIREMNIENQERQWEDEAELHAKLRKAGVKLWLGSEGQGQLIVAADNLFTGYDHGAADLMASGRIRVKQGAEPTAYSSTGLIMSDGTTLTADTVIFATGYTTMRDTAKAIFGEDLVNQTVDCMGLDNEYELLGHYRPSGHPGLWYAPGQFSLARFMSKQLAIQIKAIQIGILKQ
ncbi:hypothetical protein PHLGIDRAFT_508046 [Phlebiopsis gigantea 11061_1 CR5-6]|uniref:FAD/NAD(P)-binding domain-containing protein n=1 Tax=Phlebiopsis gigantea (strain 11061_1 CR5-6) TaxID=745531 RepID=A0A0C3P2R6_PHLG1|nr:hypothetical protein PHLGIDRAFT_508046 [Phlebiopsis gigantea 11061_1 CR5-6]